MPNPTKSGASIITKEVLQTELDNLSPSKPYRQIILSEPRRYSRGAESCQRVWLELTCEKHGPYETPVRLDAIRKDGTKCKECGRERGAELRRRSKGEIEKAVQKWARKRGFPVKFVSVSKDRKTTILRCETHGEKKKRTDKVVYTGQICEKCAKTPGFESRRYIPFKEKKRLYRKKYSPHRVDLIKEEEPGIVVYRCHHCGDEFPGSWSNIYYGGIGGCKTCKTMIAAQKRIKPIKEVKSSLKERFIKIVDSKKYAGTHHPLRLQCIRCKTIKKIKINRITHGGGFSCVCTRSIPHVVQDYVFDAVRRVHSDATSRYLFNNGKSEADIYVPSLNLFIEVKYGNTCFGNPLGKGPNLKRYKHVIKQMNGYVKSGKTILYIIIADKKNLGFIPDFPNKVSVVFLSNINESSSVGHVFSKGDLKKISDLYYTPYKSRNLKLFSSDEHKYIREALKFYLINNNFTYPSLGIIKREVGFGPRKVDRALGVARSSNMKMRAQACKYWFDLDVTTEREEYVVSSDSPKAVRLRDKLGSLLERRPVLPSDIELIKELGVRWDTFDIVLGLIQTQKNMESRKHACSRLYRLKIMTSEEFRALKREEEYEKIRSELKKYLMSNELMFPTTTVVKKVLKISYSKLDHALNLPRGAKLEARISACNKLLNLDVRIRNRERYLHVD